MRDMLRRWLRTPGSSHIAAHDVRGFSREWEVHFQSGGERTWGYTPAERLAQLLLETETDATWFAGRSVLDAGCGPGALTDEIAGLGASVVGLDRSSSVWEASRRRRHRSVRFVCGDVQAPPFAAGSFDLVVSIGVLHHTRDTHRAFLSVAQLVRPGGRLYVWLYRRPERFLGRYAKLPLYDALRFVVCHTPANIQRRLVTAYARLVRASHRLRGRDAPIPLHEYVMSAYDDLTPRWRHYHTPIEVSRWFHECGFGPAVLTHWDNPYGFGLVATKDQRSQTPGQHFGAGPKLWDDDRTQVGRLHRD